jgi:methyl-accepting chemotaxis protein
LIIDPNGIILTSKNPDELFKNVDSILPKNFSSLLENKSGSFNANGNFYVFHTSEKLGWKIIAAIPLAVINREVQKSAINPPLLSLLITIILFSSLSLLGLNTFISKPIIELSRITQQNAQSENQFQQVEVKSKDEIGQLGTAYNQMIETRKNIEIALKQERDLAKALTESLAVW